MYQRSERKSPLPQPRSTSPIPRAKTPHSSTNPARSPTKYNSLNDQDLNMRRCKSILSHADLDILLSELSKRRNDLVSSLQVYDLLRANGLPQRCTIHNNTISLYCLNEKRLLCVNCVYGAHKHRTHRVNPIKDSMGEVEKDSERAMNDIDKEFIHIRNQQSQAELNLQVLESSLTQMLQKLDTEFDEISKQLTDKYLDLKKSLIETYHQLILKHRKVLEQFSWLYSTTESTINHTKTHSEFEDQEVRRYWLKLKYLQSVGLRVKPFKKQQLEVVSKQMYKQIRKIRELIQKQKIFRF